ncbi:hypothetical protein FPOAC2_01083 [Fusarium poae]|uniref:hypothetical protein n=1 Tax=Fusarium poae TaxID=36050 RepID=UPI001CE7E6DE|nr:hypothetical protein FPOAC1_001019 [Fusarium poae]KAG8675043.1 hypothetical protein FPOAC1_001019 [Fusarium poae]
MAHRPPPAGPANSNQLGDAPANPAETDGTPPAQPAHWVAEKLASWGSGYKNKQPKRSGLSSISWPTNFVSYASSSQFF